MLNWYLITIEDDQHRLVHIFEVGFSKRSLTRHIKKKLKGSRWKYKSVRYLDTKVSELMEVEFKGIK